MVFCTPMDHDDPLVLSVPRSDHPVSPRDGDRVAVGSVTVAEPGSDDSDQHCTQSCTQLSQRMPGGGIVKPRHRSPVYRSSTSRSWRPSRPGRVGVAVCVVALGLVAGCARVQARQDGGPTGDRSAATAASSDGCEAADPVPIEAVVQRQLHHDPTSYTQGLVIVDGVGFESSGLYGESTLRTFDPADGRTIERVRVPPELFAEGIAVVDDGDAGRVLVQLTWKEGVAMRWGLTSFESSSAPLGEFTYEGEGWGLTTLADGNLLMSDGSDRLVVRNPSTFDVVAVHTVTRTDGPTDMLNELEFDGRWVWANRYQTNEIVRIDPHCWTVSGVVDVSALRERAARLASENDSGIDVPNGIAHIADDDTYLLTGKLWPVAFVVSLVEEFA